MPIRQYRPTSPGRRGMSVSTFEEITKTRPEKSLTVRLKKHAGRNNQGRIATRHRGGGAKRAYRIIDFKRNKFGVPAKVAAIEYDPNRSARIALLHYVDGEKRYIIAPVGLEVGRTVVSGPDADILVGNALLLKLPSGETRRVRVECMATVGQVGNVEHENVSLGKAGRKVWMGKRPHNRG